MFNFILPSFKFKVEKWKWNKEYRIYVSNLGNFKDEYKNNIPIMTGASSGYCRVNTPYGIKTAHRLVLLTWKPIPNAEDLTIDHLDHNKRNNTLDNLEWVTHTENLKRADADLDKSEPTLKPAQALLKSGQKTFASFDEAATWLIQHQGMKNVEKNRIVNRIKNAVKNNTSYCGRKWTLLL